MAKHALIEVVWEDSHFKFGEWESPSFCTNRSIGYLAHEDKRLLSIAMSIRDDGKFADVLTIPKKMIMSRKERK